MTASTESAERRPSICDSSFCLTTSSVTSGEYALLGQQRLDVRVRDERRACRQVDVRLVLHLLRHVRVLLDPGQERGRQRGDQDRPGQRRADRGAKLARGVLQPAHLGAVLRRHRRDRDVAELGGQRADPEPDDEHGDEHDGGVGARPGGSRSARGCRRSSASMPTRTTRRGLAWGKHARDADRRDQQRQRERAAAARRWPWATAQGRPRERAGR